MQRVNKSSTPFATTPINKVFYWRQNLAESVARWAAIVGFFAAFFASYSAFQARNYLLILIYVLLYGSLVVIAYLPRTSYRTRASAFLVLIYVTGLVTYLTYGRGSLGSVYMMVLAFTATVFYGRRAGLTALFLALMTILIMAWIFSQGWITNYTEVKSTQALGWVSNSFIMLLSGGLVVLATHFVIHNLVDLLSGSYQLTRELDTARTRLEERVEERTRSLEAARREAEAARNEAEAIRQDLEVRVWQITGQVQLNEKMRGETNLYSLAQAVINQLCHYLNTQAGVFYLLEDGVYRIVASYAFTYRKRLVNSFHPGEGLVGQVALEKQIVILTDVPQDYMMISTGLVNLAPRSILAAPILYNNQVLGVIELGAVQDFTRTQVEFLTGALETLSVTFNTIAARNRIDELLAQTQEQAAELHNREEEMQAINEELHSQTEVLRASQQKLLAQQMELAAANAQLEEKASTLQEQRAILDQQNQELITTQRELEQKAEELAQANQYKSEFLANMSHELRTPLNSMLILARLLANNEERNLTPDQLEWARTALQSGQDLLALINEILDLSKVEAGKMNFHFAPMSLSDLAQNMKLQFNQLAQEKGLEFSIALAENLADTIETDQMRFQQIIKNLLANAFKFTEQGSVHLRIEKPAPAPDEDLSAIGLDTAEAIAFRVIDTGIGMTPQQQSVVFEAFQQGDGSTSRKYGGTGLGLTISQELARRLGGKIFLQSEQGKGSTLSLILPVRQSPNPEIPALPAIHPAQPAPATTPTVPLIDLQLEQELSQPPFPDDRESLSPQDRLLLVIEDDPAFAKIIFDHAHRRGFKCLVAADGSSGLQLVTRHPPHAVLLDMKLPGGISGWQVLQTLKAAPATRHIPVHILSASQETHDIYRMGAMGFLTKPLTLEDLEAVFQKIEDFLARKVKNLLVIEDDAGLRYSICQLLKGSDIHITETALGSQALDLLRTQRFDCMILDLNLPDMTGFDLLAKVQNDEEMIACQGTDKVPVIVYTGRVLTEDENARLMSLADSVIIKGDRSPERLLDETTLFLHRVIADLPPQQQNSLNQLHDRDAVFKDRHILVVDDDLRGAFALSKLLGEKGLKVTIARSGFKALEILQADHRIDLVLMDIMMPEMDGYETMIRIRAESQFQNLPILALTAKAMKGDEAKCIISGANDYLSKPVDSDRLFSMLRVWLYR